MQSGFNLGTRLVETEGGGEIYSSTTSSSELWSFMSKSPTYMYKYHRGYEEMKSEDMPGHTRQVLLPISKKTSTSKKGVLVLGEP
jgi:hypothetical protein